MASKSRIHHADDVTIKYLTDVMPEKLHDQLGLPGKFVKNYPTRIIKRDGSEREMDWLMLVEPDNKTLFEKILINVEFQSSRVDIKKIKAISEYRDYGKTYYGFPVLTVIVITDGYENSKQEYSRVSSDIIRPVYIHMEDEKVIERLNNIERNIHNLSDNEAVEMVLLTMFTSKSKARYVTEKITKLFNKNKSIKGMFRNHIAFGLSIMIKKYFNFSKKGKELIKMLEGEVTNTKIRDVIDFEIDFEKRRFEHELNEMENKLNKKDNELNKKNSELNNVNNELNKKNDEIRILKEKLRKHNISY